MTSSNEPALALLHSLLWIYRDSAAGFALADHNMPDPDIARELTHYQQQRLRLIEEVEQRIRDLRADPGTGGTAAGAAHRSWMEGKADGAADPVEAILSEVERGEDVAVDALRGGLRQELDGLTRKLIERHYELVQAAHDRIKQLRDRHAWAQ